ncbi:MAG: DUF2076 domain-containing protein [Methylobacteriaceae bacterium]|nr:DUF2076 domain-containing protein [Methylobacteriaceae bacterium]
MTPEERQMLAGLFDRIRSQAGNPRDPEAEGFIANEVRVQTYAPYLLAQTVLVQEQGLSAAAEQIRLLQARVQSLESGAQAQPTGTGSFLGGIGRSIFGGSQPASRGSVPSYAPQPTYTPPPSYAPPPNYAPQPASGPWAQPQSSGGSFLKGALGAAAGVAGGVLLADTVRDLFAGHSATAANMAGVDPTGGGLLGTAGNEGLFASDANVDQRTQDILQDQDQDQDEAQDAADDAADNSSGDDYSGSDYSGSDFGGTTDV